MLTAPKFTLMFLTLAGCLAWLFLTIPAAELQSAVEAQPNQLNLEALAAERLRNRAARRQRQRERDGRRAVAALVK